MQFGCPAWETFSLWLLLVRGAFPNAQYLGRTSDHGQDKMLEVGMRKGSFPGTSSADCPSFYPSAGHAEIQFSPFLIFASALLFLTLETPLAR